MNIERLKERREQLMEMLRKLESEAEAISAQSQSALDKIAYPLHADGDDAKLEELEYFAQDESQINTILEWIDWIKAEAERAEIYAEACRDVIRELQDE